MFSVQEYQNRSLGYALALRELEEQQFSTTTGRLNSRVFLLNIEIDDLNPSTLWFRIFARDHNVPLVLRELAIAVVSNSGKLVATMRSNCSGRCAAKLQPGLYSFRFVDDIRTRGDVKTLFHLGDYRAFEHLEAAVICDEINADLRTYISEMRSDIEFLDSVQMLLVRDESAGAKSTVPSRHISRRLHFERSIRPFSNALFSSGLIDTAQRNRLTQLSEKCVDYMVSEKADIDLICKHRTLQALREKYLAILDDLPPRYAAIFERLDSGEFTYRLSSRKFLACRFAAFCIDERIITGFDLPSVIHCISPNAVEEFTNFVLTPRSFDESILSIKDRLGKILKAA